MSHHDTIFEMWAEFRSLYDGRDVAPATLELVRHGFYCGAIAAFLLITKGGATGETADQAIARLETLRRELDGFRYDIRRPLSTEAPPWPQ